MCRHTFELLSAVILELQQHFAGNIFIVLGLLLVMENFCNVISALPALFRAVVWYILELCESSEAKLLWCNIQQVWKLEAFGAETVRMNFTEVPL